MKSSEVVEMLRDAVAQTKELGVEQISLADLEAFATHLADMVEQTPEDVAAGEAAIEAYRTKLTEWLAARQRIHEHNLELLRSVIIIGQATLRSAMLINGGAAVVLLAFIGSVWPRDGFETQLSAIATALLCYVAGVLTAAMASGATYIWICWYKRIWPITFSV